MHRLIMEIIMSKFSKQDLQTELASIIIVMGRQIELWTGNERLVADFLGSGLQGCAVDLNPSEVDLRRFPMAQNLLNAYDYAFAPTADDVPDINALNELGDMIAGLPREDFSSNVHDFPNQGGESKIKDVCDAVWGRASIDDIDYEQTDLSIRQVALLADMTEGAVRNAMTASGEAALAAIPKSKPVRIDVDEARRWLAGRRGFIPTPSGTADDPILNERLRSFERMEQLTDFIARHALRVFGGFPQLVDALGWADEAEANTWLDGTYRFENSYAKTLGAALGADAPTFVGKALELSLRRDAETEGAK